MMRDLRWARNPDATRGRLLPRAAVSLNSSAQNATPFLAVLLTRTESGPNMDPMIGRSLGHYRIEAKIGEGGMGVVYRAFDTHLDRSVAIKILRADAIASPDRKRRFLQEAKAASALNHPNIIHIYDISSSDGA